MDELVTSIKRTEESLQRLKRLRKGADATTQNASSIDVTDETKIRKQLYLDVEQFGKEVSVLDTGNIARRMIHNKCKHLSQNGALRCMQCLVTIL